MRLPDPVTGLTLLAALNSIDWVLTMYALKHGACEQNPMLRPFTEDPAKFTSVKLFLGNGAVAAGLMTSQNLEGDAKTLSQLVVTTLLVIYVFVIVSNLMQLISYFMLKK